MNLQEIAMDLIRAVDESRPDHEHDLNLQAICVGEEAGELLGAYRRWSGQARRKGTLAELEDEVADVLIVTSVFAERAGILIEDAVAAKLEKIYSRGWKE